MRQCWVGGTNTASRKPEARTVLGCQRGRELLLGERTKGGMSGDIGPIAQHGINNLVGGWGAAVCLTRTDWRAPVSCSIVPNCGQPIHAASPHVIWQAHADA